MINRKPVNLSAAIDLFYHSELDWTGGLKIGSFSLCRIFYCFLHSCFNDMRSVKGLPCGRQSSANNSQSAEMRISPPLFWIWISLFSSSWISPILRIRISELFSGFLHCYEFGFHCSLPAVFLLSCRFGFLYYIFQLLSRIWISLLFSIQLEFWPHLSLHQGSLEREKVLLGRKDWLVESCVV